MKPKPCSHFIAALLTASILSSAGTSARADVLVRYEMTNVPPYFDSLLPSFDDPVNRVSGDYLLPGLGVGTFVLPYAGAAYPSSPVASFGPLASVLPLTNANDALAADCLLSFIITVGSAVTNLDIQGMSLDIARGGGNTNRGYGVFVTTPTTTDQQVQPSTYLLTQRPFWQYQQIDLSGVASLQGLTAGQMVTVKIPCWTESDANTVDLDNITLYGIANHTTNDAPVLPLKITTMDVQPGSISLTWASNTGRVYTVEYSLDLTNWTEFATDIPSDPGNSTTYVLDTSAEGGGTDVTLVQYQMGQSNPQIQDAARTAAGGNLTPGAGLNSFNTNHLGLNYVSTPVLLLNFLVAGPDLATAILNTNWFTFNLTVGSNVTDLDLTSLSFNVARGGGATPRGFAVYVTTPTTTDQEVQGATDVATVRPNWSPEDIDLSGVSSLQNLKAGQVITFTIPCYTPGAGSSLEFDDITVKGNVTPAPLPPYAEAKSLFLRAKEQ